MCSTQPLQAGVHAVLIMSYGMAGDCYALLIAQRAICCSVHDGSSALAVLEAPVILTCLHCQQQKHADCIGLPGWCGSAVTSGLLACSLRWADDYPDSWEPEDRLPQQLVAAWEEQQRERLLSSMHCVSGSGRGTQQGGNGCAPERMEPNKPGEAARRHGVAAHAGEGSMQNTAVGV